MAKAHETSPARPTDREQLRQRFDSVFEDINALLAERDDRKREELQEALDPLCFMRRVEHTIQIAWGGPEYGFKLSYDPETREWVGGKFYWADWFKYEEESLSDTELDQVVAAYSMDCVVEQ